MPGPNVTRNLILAQLRRAGILAPGGTVYYVDSTNVNNSNLNTGLGTFTQGPGGPFATLAFAVTKVANNKNDVIILMPGHAETIAVVAGILCDTAVANGYSIIGLGNGPSRPTITWSATASTWRISATGVFLNNIVCKVSIDEVVSMFDVQGDSCVMDNVEFVETATLQAIQFVLTKTNGTRVPDYFELRNSRHIQATAAAANSQWIAINGGNGHSIHDNRFKLTTTSNAASNVIATITAAPTSIAIYNNIIEQLGGTATVPISMLTATDGIITNNFVSSLKTAIAGSIAAASCFAHQNFASHTVNKSGFLEPAVDT